MFTHAPHNSRVERIQESIEAQHSYLSPTYSFVACSSHAVTQVGKNNNEEKGLYETGTKMPVKIEVVGLKRLKRRMRQFPQEYNKAVEKTLQFSLLKIWENVFPYPKQPKGSKYVRTGTLGKSLGSGTTGGKSQGEPDIFEIFEQGGNIDSAEFGTKLEYAPYVLGEEQAQHMSHWWTFRKLARKSRPEIIRAFKLMTKKLVKFLEGKGQL